DLVVIYAFRAGNRLAEHVDIRVAPPTEIVAEWIDTFSAGLRLIFFEELGCRLHQPVGRHPCLIVDDPVELWSKLALEDRGLQSDHRASNDLRLVVELTDRLHNADGAKGVGADD